MSQVEIRERLVNAVNDAFTAQYPNVPIVYPNQVFDRNKPPSLWVEYEIKFAGGRQIGMSALPKTRIHGFVYVTVWCREGNGQKGVLGVCDWFSEQLQYKTFGTVNLKAAEPVSDTPPTGWFFEQVKLYFYTNPT